MKLPTIISKDRIALTVSAVALIVSTLSLVQSHNASNQTRWAAFRSNAIVTLEMHRRAYSQVTCVFSATNTRVGLERLERFKSDTDDLESDIHKLRTADDATLTKFEALLDATNANFHQMNDALSDFKTQLTNAELERVNSICGSPFY